MDTNRLFCIPMDHTVQYAIKLLEKNFKIECWCTVFRKKKLARKLENPFAGSCFSLLNAKVCHALRLQLHMPLLPRKFSQRAATIFIEIKSRFETRHKPFNIFTCVHLPGRGEFLHWKKKPTDNVREKKLNLIPLDLNICQLTCFHWHELIKPQALVHVDPNRRCNTIV